MTPEELYGPWEVAGFQVRVEVTDRVRLVADRDGERLRALPAAVRESGDLAWIRLALDAARRHFRDLIALLEHVMTEGLPLSGPDLAALALDPVGRAVIERLVLRTGGHTGRLLVEDWLVETVTGELAPLVTPAGLPHPVRLEAEGLLAQWDRWLNRQPFRQPFKQIRREVYVPNQAERAARWFSSRLAGDRVRWDQARALLESRAWNRVTKTGAERIFSRRDVSARVEFRTPASRSFPKEHVVLNRIYFLRPGDEVVNRARPGLPLDTIPPEVFSETLRDVTLIARVAGIERYE